MGDGKTRIIMKKTVVCLAALLLLAGLFTFGMGASGGAISTPLGAKEYNGHYYRYFGTAMTWSEAAAYCEARGGHLATVTSAEENVFVTSLFSAESALIGGNDVAHEGSFVWCTGEEFAYTNWAPGEPNNGNGRNQDYLHVYKNGTWDDIEEDRGKMGFVCEWDSWEREVTVAIPEDAILYGDHYYKLYTLSYDWESAAYYCDSLGGHLATIANAGENTFISSLIQGNPAWIGGSDMANEGVFEWITGEPFLYQNWNGGEPNNDYGNQDHIQLLPDGVWDDETYTVEKYFVCEWDYCCISENGYSETHSFSAWAVATPPSCHASGEEERICGSCGQREARAVDQLVHQFGEWETKTPPTCHRAGTEERLCGLCGDAESRSLDQLIHQFGEYTVVSGSALIPPIVKEKTCALCGEVETHEDWSQVWITVLAAVGVIALGVGLINYMRAFKKR